MVDAAELTRLGRILALKDTVANGASRTSVASARDVLEQLRRFADWAETELAR